MRPSATIARNSVISAMVASRKLRQVAISAGVGLFSGGTQRTALVIRASISSRLSSTRAFELPACETEFDQRRKQQVAGIVAGEGPAGAVRALQAGREPDDQKTRLISDRTRRPAR